jgi:hypothetical protein
VERLWARLKEWRAIATRYEKTASSFMGVLCLAATLDWIKRERALALQLRSCFDVGFSRSRLMGSPPN